MTKEELVSAVAVDSSISEEEALKIIDAFTKQIKEQLSHGEKVSIAGFGSFVISKRGAKTFVNPKNGQEFEIPERNLPHFKAGGEFKKSLKDIK